MNDRMINITELRLRATGLSREDGQRLGTAVAHRLAALSMQTGRVREISNLSIQVRAPAGAPASIGRLADIVVDQIRRQLE